jgi:hypothetical protein
MQRVHERDFPHRANSIGVGDSDKQSDGALRRGSEICIYQREIDGPCGARESKTCIAAFAYVKFWTSDKVEGDVSVPSGNVVNV